MINVLLALFTATVMVSHIGIAWSGILTTPGNLFDWVPGKIQKIKNPYLQDLLSCAKCISGQCALWLFVGLSIYTGDFHWFFSVLVCIAWMSLVIVVTDQLVKRYGYG